MSRASEGLGSSQARSTTGTDWTVQAADAIESVVVSVRSKTTDPLIGVSRWIVYGTLAAIVGLVAATVAIIGLVRVLDVILPGEVWVVDVLLGGIFTVIGLFLWSRRPARRSAD
jgi:hypothetical protein